MYNKVTSWHFIIKKVFAPFLFSCKQNIDYEEKMHLLIHKTRDLKFYGTTASKNVLWCKNKCEHKFPLGKFISCRFFPVANNILHKNTEKSVFLSIKFLHSIHNDCLKLPFFRLKHWELKLKLTENEQIWCLLIDNAY